jgi:hypothetical protein
LKGLALKGLTLEELTLEGLALQGLTLQGLTLERLTLDGLTFEGLTLKGLTFEGLTLQRYDQRVMRDRTMQGEKMTNYLAQVNQAIKADPHGTVARHASRWLAIEVMGWHYINDPAHFVGYFIPFEVFEKLEAYRGVSECGAACMMDEGVWKPFTDANHALTVLNNMEDLANYLQSDDIYSFRWFLKGCLAWMQHALDTCCDYGTLTDNTLKGWLNHD